MKCLDFDQQFERYMRAWMKENAEKYGNNMDVIEGMMPDIYMEFLAKPAGFLDGIAPQDYFEQFDLSLIHIYPACARIAVRCTAFRKRAIRNIRRMNT